MSYVVAMFTIARDEPFDVGAADFHFVMFTVHDGELCGSKLDDGEAPLWQKGTTPSQVGHHQQSLPAVTEPGIGRLTRTCTTQGGWCQDMPPAISPTTAKLLHKADDAVLQAVVDDERDPFNVHTSSKPTGCNQASDVMSEPLIHNPGQSCLV